MYNPHVMESLKPQDVVVVLKICSLASAVKPREHPAMAWLGIELGLSSSEVHAAFRRLRASGLLHPETLMIVGRDAAGAPRSRWVRGKPESIRPNMSAVAEFLVHGLKYVFPPKRGELTRGVPT